MLCSVPLSFLVPVHGNKISCSNDHFNAFFIQQQHHFAENEQNVIVEKVLKVCYQVCKTYQAD